MDIEPCYSEVTISSTREPSRWEAVKFGMSGKFINHKTKEERMEKGGGGGKGRGRGEMN